jgi:hypothetical protein
LIDNVSAKAITDATEKFHPDIIALKTMEFYSKVIERKRNS